MRMPRGIPQGGDADALKSGGGARGEPRESGIRTERNTDQTRMQPKSFPTLSQSLPSGTRVASQSLPLPPIGCPLHVPVGPVPLPSYT